MADGVNTAGRGCGTGAAVVVLVVAGCASATSCAVLGAVGVGSCCALGANGCGGAAACLALREVRMRGRERAECQCAGFSSLASIAAALLCWLCSVCLSTFPPASAPRVTWLVTSVKPLLVVVRAKVVVVLDRLPRRVTMPAFSSEMFLAMRCIVVVGLCLVLMSDDDDDGDVVKVGCGQW